MVACPFLEGDIEGIRCRAAGVNVEYIDGADISICMGERREEYIYPKTEIEIL